MKKIFIYGDSNTWGSKAGGIPRHSYEDRWTSILQEKLGSDYEVLPNGLVGRHAGSFATPLLDGQIQYEAVYRSVEPVDIIIIALGGNDLKDRYMRSPDEIVEDVLWYETKTKKLLKKGKKKPTFVYILQPKFKDLFTGRKSFNVKKRKIVNKKLKNKVKNYVHVDKVNLSEDGIHFSAKGHKKMAKAVYKKIMELEK